MSKKKTAHKSTSDSGDQVQIVRANLKREEVVSPDFVSLYANDTQFQTSPWDIRLIFGVIDTVPTNENPTMVVKKTGEVRMSPQHAKKITQLLLEQLAGYEKRFGPIPQPTN